MASHTFLLTTSNGGSDLRASAVAELQQLGAVDIELVPSAQARIFFRLAEAAVGRLAALTTPEKVHAVVLRRPADTLALPDGGPAAEDALGALVVAAEGWPTALGVWAVVTGGRGRGEAAAPVTSAAPVSPAAGACHQPRTFRVTGRRAGRRAAHLSSSGISEAAGAALMRARGWEVALKAFELEVLVHLNDELLLVLLPLLGRARPSSAPRAGLSPPVAWAMARSAAVQPGELSRGPQSHLDAPLFYFVWIIVQLKQKQARRNGSTADGQASWWSTRCAAPASCCSRPPSAGARPATSASTGSPPSSRVRPPTPRCCGAASAWRAATRRGCRSPMAALAMGGEVTLMQPCLFCLDNY
jgi:hypothetical protein